MHSLAILLSTVCLTGVAFVAPATASASPVDRSQIPEKDKWNLGDLFPSDNAWAEAKATLTKQIARFGRHKGRLGQGPRAIADAMSEMGTLQNQLQRVVVYAQTRSDEDTRDPKPRAMRAEALELGVRFDTETAWIRPGLVALPSEKIRTALAKEPRLREWSFYLNEVLRQKPHILRAEEERIVAMTGEMSSAPSASYGILKDADLPYPTVILSTGEKVRLDPAAFARTRSSPVRADRLKVFQYFFSTLKGFERTTGSMLYAQLRAHSFNREVHRFDSSLEAALFWNNIPVTIYRQLIADVNANLPVLHRYLALRQRILGLTDLGYEDLYAPLVAQIERRYTIDEAKAMTLASVAPLGEAYQHKLRDAYSAGWTDFLPSTGKRAGAYSIGAYGVHPYQLLNFNGQWEDVSTLAHESGHSIHTTLAMQKQPFPTWDYATFIAEIASTLNENLLFRHALSEARSDQERLALLGQRLESVRTTLFRQTMFAEFEMAIHERAEKGEALTGEALSAAYIELVRRYYGHDKQVCRVADLYSIEWSFVPHFYWNFYVYQYATSLVASSTLARSIVEDQARGSTAARDRYLALLSEGGSDHPTDLLKRAGVDMTTPAPFQAAIDEMVSLITQIESLLPATRKVNK